MLLLYVFSGAATVRPSSNTFDIPVSRSGQEAVNGRGKIPFNVIFYCSSNHLDSLRSAHSRSPTR